MSLATISNWGFNLVVTVTFLGLINLCGRSGTFLVYAVLTLVALVFTAAPGARDQGAQPGGDRGRAGRAHGRRAGRRGGTVMTRVAVVGLACLLAAVACLPAMAQTVENGIGLGPSQPVAPPPALPNVAPSVEHLFGDLGGVRSNLENRGIYLLLDATTEFAGNVSGGVKQGATFANQVGFEADIDWQRLAGIMGLSTHLIIVNRSGSSDSNLFGDNVLPVQEIYGAGGNVAFHLVSLSAEQSLFDGRLDIAAGRMNVENDFASSPLYCNFMNNGLCGDPKALPGGDIGHSAFPDAAWAARVRVRPTPDTYVADRGLRGQPGPLRQPELSHRLQVRRLAGQRRLRAGRDRL